MSDMDISSSMPPRLTTGFLSWSLPNNLRDPVLGDLFEEYQQKVFKQSRTSANYWYRKQALKTAFQFLKKTKRGLLMFLFSLLIFTGLTTMAMILSGNIFMFIDVPSLLLIFPPAVFFGIAATSWQDLKNAFLFILNNQTEQPTLSYIRTKRTLSVIGNVGVTMGIFVTIIGWVAIANNIKTEDFADHFGPAIAVSVLTLMYGTGLKLICYVAEMKLQSLSEQ